MKILLLALLPLAPTFQDPALPTGGQPTAATALQDTGDAAAGTGISLPDGAAAVIGEEVISMDEYLNYLLEISGRRPLRDLVRRKLLQREAQRLGVEVEEAVLDAEVEAFWETLRRRHRGDETALHAELEREGHDAASYRLLYRTRRRAELLGAAICRATREISAEQIQERFEQEYGHGGVRTRVRHIYFNAARLRRDLERAGEPVDSMEPAEVEARLMQSAERVAARLRAGEAFETVAREKSHDLSVHQNGGEIPGYNYRRYGSEFAEAVRAAELGVLFGPIRTQTGLHVAEVLERTSTDLEEVRAAIVATLTEAAPSPTELRDLDTRLRTNVRITTF